MSFQLAIPWQVELPQSLPPLHQPAHTLQEKRLRSTIQFQRTASSVLTVCLTPGDNPTPLLWETVTFASCILEVSLLSMVSYSDGAGLGS